MTSQPQSAVTYKWDAKTWSGYRLLCDSQRAREGLSCAFHLEDWDHYRIIHAWDFDSLEGAVAGLAQLFEIDTAEELAGLRKHFGHSLRHAA